MRQFCLKPHEFLPFLFWLNAVPALADSLVIPDETLGDEASLIREVDDLTQHIEGGALRGSNLFHSFLEFNVAVGNSVYFANPLDITSILTRVTGANPSNILGQLGVLGEADLFLLNPNGIVFGENASLDIAGSFHAIAAPAIPLGEGVFSAVEPESSSLLSVSPDASLFNYLGNGTGDVTNDGSLVVGDGQSLTLLGDTTLSSGELTAAGGTVRVLGNRVGLIEQATVDVSAAESGGTVLIGGEFQGQAGLPTAERTYVGPEVTVMADAHGLGDGGRVIVWADEATQFAGSISARGGEAGGDGGFVEVSGLESLAFTGMVDTQAMQGEAGELLLDPANIVISEEFVPTVNETSVVFDDFVYGKAEDTDKTSVINPVTLLSLLWKNDLTLEATDTIAVIGNVNNAFNDNNLTLIAKNIVVFGVRLNQSSGGKITLETPQTEGSSILINDASIETNNSFATEVKSGEIIIKTFELKILDTGTISTSSFGRGGAGAVNINASGDILLDGEASSITNEVVSIFGEGDSGGITIATDNLSVLNGASISTAPFFDSESSGVVKIDASGDILLDGEASSITGGIGGITTTTDDLSILNGATISATNGFDREKSGVVEIYASGDIVLDGESSSITNEVDFFGSGEGESGGITIATDNLLVLNGATISANTSGIGNSGVVKIDASGDVLLDGESSSITNEVFSIFGEGDSGGITIAADNLSVLNGASISASTSGRGNSGVVKIDAFGDIILNEKSSITNENGGARSFFGESSESGGITITTDNLSVLSGASISASTSGGGSSDVVKIDAFGDIILNGKSSITNENKGVGSFIGSPFGESGESGGITITTDNLSVLNGANISASTSGGGSSGVVKIDAFGDIMLNEKSSITNENKSVGSFIGLPFGESGESGGITITTDNLSVLSGASISATTFGKGNSGAVKIDASSDVLLDGESSITNEVAFSAEGNSGGITIATDNLSLLDRSDISATTSGAASGGEITIHTRNNLAIRSQSRVTVESSFENAGRAGNLNVFAESALLDGNVELSARSASTEGGGNINFDVDEVLQLRNGSFINAESTNPNAGDGGNVNINAEFVVAFPDENSDIIANAVGGNGGRIDINATGVYGLSENSGNTNDIRANGTSDISASSEFGQRGTVALNTLVTDPTQGQAALTDTFVNPDDLISTSCIARDTQAVGTFTIPGSGGLPTTPDDSTTSTYSTGTVEPLTDPIPAEPDDMSWQPGDPIVEPEAATQLADGRIVIARYCHSNQR